MLGWETRNNLIQEYHKGVSEPKKVVTVEKLKVFLASFPFPCTINKSRLPRSSCYPKLKALTG